MKKKWDKETLKIAIELAGEATAKQFWANLKTLVPKEVLEKQGGDSEIHKRPDATRVK